MRKKGLEGSMAVLLCGCVLAITAAMLVSGCKSTSCHAKMGKPQTMCPVCEHPMKTEYYSDYQGKRVFFCGSDCVAKFEKAPSDYFRAMGDAGVDLVDVTPQTECPVAKTAIDKNIYTDYKGQRIYFASEDCKQTFMKDPDKYMKGMITTGVAPAKSPA